ncbi:hypothetical protein [Cohnella lupini]|uniref:Uncharacterized protein n=1 Tax=Cohnella lupini TaxID=1294267 RepID=A0A3D9IBS9_9BACL|nr:hypothetical protein [Cohnella lupini]RED59253.1 hypothetical protein DFP95_10792 [Cohnella lupini]
MRIGIAMLYAYLMFSKSLIGLPDGNVSSSMHVAPTIHKEDQGEYKALRAGRGSFRSPRSGYNGGIRNQRPGTNNPVARTPAASTNRFGGFFGGVLAGTFLGGLLNPFGFGGTGGFSFFGLVFWGIILYLVIRFLRNRFGSGNR